MTRGRMIGWLLAGGAACVSAAALAGQAAMLSSPAIVEPMAARVMPATQAVFDGYVLANKMPGIVGAFGAGDGPTVFVSAGHVADEPGAPAAGPDTLWRVYSMTKPVTALAAMILIDEGKLKLDQPISDFLPAFAHMQVLTDPDRSLASRPATRPITVRNLLTHTAGLGYNIITKGPLLAEYNRLGITPGAINATLELQAGPARPRSLQEFANRVATLPLIADPGTRWSYSIGLDLMGAVIEKAGGMPFDSFVQRRIFAPLGMRSSYWTVPSSEVGRFATNYAFKREGLAMLFPGARPDPAVKDTDRLPIDRAAQSVYLQRPSFPYGGAGLVMSARDYDRFLHCLQNEGSLDGVRLIRAETARLMMSNLLPPGVVFTGINAVTGGPSRGPKLGFGAGGSVYLEDGPGGTPGKGTYGWGGAAGTIAFVDPARHARGTIMVNYFPSEKWPVRTEVAAALAADAARNAARRAGAP